MSPIQDKKKIEFLDLSVRVYDSGWDSLDRDEKIKVLGLTISFIQSFLTVASQNIQIEFSENHKKTRRK